MINGQIGQWIREGYGHWMDMREAIDELWAMAAGAQFSRMTETLIIAGITALITVVSTTYVLSARLEERNTAMTSLMQHLSEDHKEFYRLLGEHSIALSRVEARQVDVRHRLDIIENGRKK